MLGGWIIKNDFFNLKIIQYYILLFLTRFYKMEIIDNHINKYFEFVFKFDRDDDGNLWCEKSLNNLEDYFKNEFIFSATQNWMSGFNFVDWLNGTGDMGEFYKAIEKPGVYESIINDSNLMYQIIKEIMLYYENTKDESITFDNLNPEKILCIYAYIYAVKKYIN